MTSTFSFRNIFYGILILLLAGFLWVTMQTCQKAGTEIGQATDNASKTYGKIGDAASELKDKTAGMADQASESAGGILGKAAEKTGDAYRATADIAGKAADKAGAAVEAAGDMADKTAQKAGGMTAKALEKTGDAYQATSDMAGKAVEKASRAVATGGEMAVRTAGNAGEAQQAAGDMAANAAEKAQNAFPSKESAEDQRIEVAAGFKTEDFGNSPPQTLSKPMVTADGNWVFEGLQFDYNRSDLRPGAFASLRELAATLRTRSDLNIEIQGYTDNRGDRDYNIDLSERRAQSVKAFLESQGISTTRMTIRGFGPDRPMFSNFSEEGFAKNRRVEIKPLN